LQTKNGIVSHRRNKTPLGSARVANNITPLNKSEYFLKKGAVPPSEHELDLWRELQQYSQI